MTEAMHNRIAQARAERDKLLHRLLALENVLSEVEQRAPLPESSEEMLEQYLTLRAAKTEFSTFTSAHEKQLKARMQRIENELMQRMSDQGLTQIGSKSGTAYIKQVTSATVADWDTLLKYAIDTDQLHLLGKHVNKTAVAEFVKEKDDIPPGVNWYAENVVSIRT